VGVLLCGCPGDPVEGQTDGGSNGESTTTDGSATVTVSASVSETATITMGSQSGTDSSGSSVTIATAEDTSDPTSATLEETGMTSASETIGDTTIATTDETTTTVGTTESTGPAQCVELDEPNNEPGEALDQGVVACNDANDAHEVTSVADAATSTDWFRYTGTWSEVNCGGGDSVPRVDVVAGGPLEICIFLDCPASTEEEVACQSGGFATPSPDGTLPGCCGTDVAHAWLNCPGGDEGADVFVQVTTDASACSEYTLQLTF